MAWRRVIKGAIDEVIDEMGHPKTALSKVASSLRQRYYKTPARQMKA
jgi:hypothetical protein